MSSKLQYQAVLSILKTGRRITRYDCRALFGSESLHSVISDLRNNKHYPIESKSVNRLDSLNKPKNVSLYWLNEDYLKEKGVILEKLLPMDAALKQKKVKLTKA